MLLPATAFADWAPPAYEYLDEDPDAQRTTQQCTSGCLLTENYTFYHWMDWWQDYTLDWYCNPDPTYHACVEQAITNWENAFPQTQWAETLNPAEADVQFLLVDTSQLPDGPTPAYAFHHGWYDDELRYASFWDKAEVGVDPINFLWASADVLTGAIAHEIGHLFGLHDRYYMWQPEPGVPDPPILSACNPDEVTIMDTCNVWWDPQEGKLRILGHCDGLTGPDQEDIDRVDPYWGEGELASWTAEVYGSPSVLSMNWRDRAWTECHANLHYYYWNGNSWVHYDGLCYNPDMGLHEDYPNGLGDRTIFRNNIPENFGAADKWNCCCGWPYFKTWDVVGTWTCSPFIWVP